MTIDDSDPGPRKITRSRGGCTNCKRLKIKCDETKPRCEYCKHTNKDCSYLPPKPRKPRTSALTAYMVDDTDSSEPGPFLTLSIANSLAAVRSKPFKPRPSIIPAALSARGSTSSDSSDSRSSTSSFSTASSSSSVSYSHDLKIQTLINSPSQQLNISRFELRVFDFFNQYCTNLLTFGANKKVDRVWKLEVPSLFVSSPLVRLAMFSFATINLWPLCDLIKVQELDYEMDSKNLYTLPNKLDFHDKNRTSPAESHHLVHGDFHSNLYGSIRTDDNSTDSLYARTTQYFMDTLNHSNDIITKIKTTTLGDHDKIANQCCEMAISGIIIFAFLGIHPHKLLPLVDFSHDPNNVESEYMSSEGTPFVNDFVSLSQGIRNVTQMSGHIVFNSRFRDIFLASDAEVVRPRKLKDEYYIIKQLKYHLSASYPFDVINSSTSFEINVISEQVFNLESALYGTINFNYPVPLFRWIIFLSEDFIALVRRKNYCALHLLYIFACLCLVTNFALFNKTNMWLDYIDWFKLSFPMNEYDQKFFQLASDFGFKIGYMKFLNIGVFDPVKIHEELLNGFHNPLFI